MQAEIGDLVAAIAKGKGAKFASFTYRAKESGELARHTVILGADTETLYQKDVAALNSLVIGDLEPLTKQAALQLLASRQESLLKGIGQNSAYTCVDLFTHIPGFKGIKVHVITGNLYIDGLQEAKVVLEPGEFKKVNSAPLTIEKNKIRRELPSGRFRTFILENVKSAKLNGETLEIEVAA